MAAANTTASASFFMVCFSDFSLGILGETQASGQRLKVEFRALGWTLSGK
jgi:hypothetical protein